MPLGTANKGIHAGDYQAMPDENDGSHVVHPTAQHRASSAGVPDRSSDAASAELMLGLQRHSAAHTDLEKHKGSTLYGVTGYIIITEFCERLAYYGFAGSLVLLFETELGMTNAEADTQYALWSGVCYVTPLLGGWIADSYLGRYNSILFFSTMYLIALFVAAGSCVPGRVSPMLLFPAIYVLALGTGGIKSSVSVFGADQFDENDPRDVQEKQSFFNWFYWSINLGALVSYTLVSYVCQYGLPFLGGQEWGFMVGYSIPCIAMSLALVVFMAGTPKYRKYPPAGSVITRAAGIVAEAAWSRRRVGGAERGVADGGREGFRGEQPKWLQRASERSGGSYPDEEVAAVSRVWKLLPFLALQVPYWAVYAQMSTAFQNQGCQMNLALGGFDVPVAALNMFDTLAILCLIPLVDRGLYPWLRRMGCEPTMLRKIGAGLLFAGAAVLVAAGVEVARRRGVGSGDDAVLSPCRRARDYDPEQFQEFWKTRRSSHPEYRPAYCHQMDGCSELGPDGLLSLDCIDCEPPPLSSDLSVLWQVPQFLLIGASEIFSSVTSLEFFYAEAPTTMRGVSAGLNLLTTALGSWITVPLIRLVNSGAFGGAWVPDDLNTGHLELYFCLLAGMVAVSLCVFILVSKRYHYQGSADASPAVSGRTEIESVESGSSTAGREDGELRSPVQSWEEDTKLLPAGTGVGNGSDSPTFGRI